MASECNGTSPLHFSEGKHHIQSVEGSQSVKTRTDRRFCFISCSGDGQMKRCKAKGRSQSREKRKNSRHGPLHSTSFGRYIQTCFWPLLLTDCCCYWNLMIEVVDSSLPVIHFSNETNHSLLWVLKHEKRDTGTALRGNELTSVKTFSHLQFKRASFHVIYIH